MNLGEKSGRRSGTLFDRSNQLRIRVLALFFTVLLVSSVALAPIAAGAPAPSTDSTAVPLDQPAQQSQPLPSTRTSGSAATTNTSSSAPGGPLSPRASFVEARAELDNLSDIGPGNPTHLDRARSQYDRAIAGFTDPVHPSNETALNAAKKGTNALHAAVARSRGKQSVSPEQRSRIDNASALAVRGANRTAAWQLRAAERALDAHAPNLDQGTESRLRSRLENARKAIRRGQTTGPDTNRTQGKKGKEKSDLARTVKQRANAINQYRISWRHSTAVLDSLENSDVESTLTDTDGDGLSDSLEAQLGTNASNPDTDGDNITDYVETAGGFPIDTDRDGDIDARDMDSDADDVGDVDPREGTKDTDGDGVLNFRDTDDDGDGIPTAVEVADGFEWAHDADFDDTPNWVDTDADGDGKPDAEEGRSDADADGMPDYLDNDRDNDGLPDFYERNVTNTDPSANDSDSAVTAHDEAGNDVIDGMEDFDGDTLGTYREYTIGTDPLSSDTDGDGLPDGFEQRRAAFDPLVPDSNGDGTLDGDADPDGDGLTNVEEYEHRTAYDVADTDRDGINDGREIELGTDPLAADSDDDGLPDRVELRLGTDPGEPDTDADGTLDGNETFETETTNESLGTTISLTGEGNAAQGVTIQNQTSTFQSGDDSIPLASPVIDIHARDNFSSANITFQYNASEFSEAEASDLAVFRYDPKRQTFVKLDSRVDTANHTVTAETSHFSIYTVIPAPDWESRFQSDLPSPWSVEEDFDTLGVWSCEGSCATEEGRLKAGNIGSTSEQVSQFDNVSGGDFTTLCVALPGSDSCDADGDGIPNGEDPCPRSYGTHCSGDPPDIDGDGIRDSRDPCPFTPGTECGPGDGDDGYGGDDGSDGDSGSTQYTEVTRTYSFDDVRHVDVQLRVKGSVSESDSTAYVEIGDERVFEVDSTSGSASKGWQTVTSDVRGYAGGDLTVRVVSDNQSVVQVDSLRIETHSDRDSIPDNIEREGMPTGWGSTVFTDPNSADSDGDGLDDDEEIFIDDVRTNPSTGEQYYGWQSDPTEVDTDGDGLDDATELEGWEIRVATSASQAERYADRLKDVETHDDYAFASSVLSSVHVDSDPLRGDTDGDGLDDFSEYTKGSNPKSTDTDRDSISDSRETGVAGDIVIHDHEPPTVEVRSIRTNDATRTAYNVTYRLSDPSGLDMAYIYKKGSRQVTINAGGNHDDPRTEWGYHWASFSVERGVLEKIKVGGASFVTGASVDIEASDIHGNQNRRKFSGPDTFGMAADAIQNTPIPGAGKWGAYLLMSLFSGVTTSSGTAVMDLADFVLHPVKRSEEMTEFAAYVSENQQVLEKLPGMMIDQVQETQDRKNPFSRSEDAYSTFSKGWYTGYVTGFVLTEAVLGKGIGAVVNRLRHSARLNNAMRALRRAGRAVDPGIAPRVLAFGGRLDRATPDVDVDTGRYVNYLGRQSQTAQYRIARQVDRVSDSTWRTLDDLDVPHPATKVARGVKTSGATFRRALGEVSAPAKAALLRLTEDVATERAMLRAWENGEISTWQLAKGVRRFDELDANEKAFVRESLTESDDGTMALLSLDVCNSPCDDPIDWAFELSRDRPGLDNTRTKEFLQAVREGGDVSIGPGASREQILESIDYLADEDVNGLDRAIRDIAGTKTGYKQIAGESYAARTVLDRGIDPANVKMQNGITKAEVPDGYPALKETTEIDVDVDGPVRIDGETLDSPAIEVKYYDPSSWKSFMSRTEITDLRDKLRTQAAAGEDELVVVMTEEFLEENAERLDELPSDVRQHSAVDQDTSVTIITFKDLNSV